MAADEIPATDEPFIAKFPVQLNREFAATKQGILESQQGNLASQPETASLIGRHTYLARESRTLSKAMEFVSDRFRADVDSRIQEMPKRAMKRAKRLPPAKDNTPLPSFADIARLVVPTNTPPWLPNHFKRWASSLMLDCAVWKTQPTKVTMKRRLAEVSNAAALLDKALSDTAITEFLEHVGRARIENIGGLQGALQLIAKHAAIAAAAPILAEATGKTRRGRGKATPAHAIPPKAFCALMIAETWMHFRGRYPGSRNPKAAEAADSLWRIAGGEVTGWGKNRLTGWRYYFEMARRAPEEALRKEYRRHLTEAAHQHRLMTQDQG